MQTGSTQLIAPGRWIEVHFDVLAKVVNWHAARLAQSHRAFRQDQDEVAQELWRHLVGQATKYEALRSQPQTFAVQICQSGVLTLLRRRQALKRSAHQTQQLSTNWDAEAHSPARGLRNGRFGERLDADSRRSLELDVADLLRRLSPDLQRLAVELQDSTPSQAAAALHLSPSDLRRRIQELRQWFQRSELDQYHPRPPRRHA